MAPSNSKLIAELMNNNTTIDADAIPNGAGVAVGTVISHGESTPPTGFLSCDGSEISVTTYADLYNVLGTTWGTLTDGAGDAGTDDDDGHMMLMTMVEMIMVMVFDCHMSAA